MREKRLFTAFRFATTFDAIEAHRVLEEAGFVVRTIPRPVAVGSVDCGVAVRVESADTESARRTLFGAGLRVSSSVAIEDF